jgi:hypothetical protein
MIESGTLRKITAIVYVEPVAAVYRIRDRHLVKSA